MTIVTIVTTPTYRSLIKRRKSDLVMLLDGIKRAAGAEGMTMIEFSEQERRSADALARDILTVMREIPEGGQ